MKTITEEDSKKLIQSKFLKREKTKNKKEEKLRKQENE